MKNNSRKKSVAIIGLGYVGLPLAVEFAKHRQVVGYDNDCTRVLELQNGIDRTLECTEAELAEPGCLLFSNEPSDLAKAEIYIVTVPTPVDSSNRPDLSYLENASSLVGEYLKQGDIVIFESTVFPGATEEHCVPMLERASGLTFNRDFYCGYSPERINPGDKNHRVSNIVKVTSGSTDAIAREVDALYAEVVKAGTFLASSIKVAEASKVIENTQRDLNIALMNELSILFHRLNIDTTEVIEAASTKWNFLPFRPGLVGGHCIGVDPYYLTHKAQQVGYHPDVILAGRRVNNAVVQHVADQTIRLMIKNQHDVAKSRVLVLGLAFKENCPDIRNTMVSNLVYKLDEYCASVDVYDPWIDIDYAKESLGVNCLEGIGSLNGYEAIIVAVGHKEFIELGPDGIRKLGVKNAVLFDVKSLFAVDESDARL